MCTARATTVVQAGNMAPWAPPLPPQPPQGLPGPDDPDYDPLLPQDEDYDDNDQMSLHPKEGRAEGAMMGVMGVATAVMMPLLPQSLITMTMTQKLVSHGPVGPLPKQGWRPGPFMTSSIVCV